MRRTFILVTLSVILCSCALPFSEKVPPERTYFLKLEEPENYSGNPIERSMRIAVVNVGVGLRTDRIMAINGHELLPVIGSRWAESTAELLEKTLTWHFSGRRMFERVTSDPLGRSADWVLELDFQEFYLVLEDGRPDHVRVSFIAQLKDNGRRNVLASGAFSQKTELQGDDTADVVEAFGATLDQLIARLTDVIPEELSGI